MVQQLYPNQIATPRTGQVTIFRNKQNGHRYYMRSNRTIVKMDDEVNGETFNIYEKNINYVKNDTEDSMDILDTDRSGIDLVTVKFCCQPAGVAHGLVGSGAGSGRGRAGSQGVQGPQGPGAGAQGFQGATGPQGVQGPIGPQGSQGSQGERGFQGFQGSQGPQGFQGSGSQGAQGERGVQGFQGFQGSQGSVGSQGSQGFQGVQGTQGNQGSQGFQGFQGSGAQGAQGSQGNQGPQGSQGFQGSGAQGSQGFQGSTGAQGNQGFQGFQGPQGIQGPQGFQGTAGPQGSQGSQGTQGVQGSQGGGILAFAEFVQHSASTNGTVPPGTAIEYLTDHPTGVFDTIGIATTTGPGAVGTEFLLPIGFYMVDYENGNTAAVSQAIYTSVTTQTEVIDIDTAAGAATGTTWIHGRGIIDASASPIFFFVSAATGVLSIPNSSAGNGDFLARLTIIKIG